MRTFEQTHPWLSFQIDTSRLSARAWLLLGEAQSKCDHIAGVPLRPSTAQELHSLYLAKGALGTTAIEGNTLSEEQVLQHIDGKLELPKSKEYLGQEIDNIVQACSSIASRVIKEDSPNLSREEICDFNRQVLDKLAVDDGVITGEIRSHSVGVRGTGYRGAPAEDCEYLVDRLCGWLNDMVTTEDKYHPLATTLLKAIIAHLYVAWIHPFGDGNGRTARLLEFKILLTSGVPTPAAHLLSNFYNETRSEYYRLLSHASRSGGDLGPFIEYAVQGFVDGLKEQLARIREQQWDITWRNYIHESFRDKNRATDIRRRHLALDLSLQSAPVDIARIPDLTTRLAKHYAKRATNKPVGRDVAALEKMDIVAVTGNTVRAKREKILSFLPYRRNTTQG